MSGANAPAGLITAHVATCSPAASAGSTLARCSADPLRHSAPITTLAGMNGPGCRPRPRSSATIAANVTPCPAIPAAPESGTSKPSQPRSPICRA